MDIVNLKINEIIPYEKNPRINDKAAKEVAKSIKECGYCNPIIIDENHVVLAGHTRLKALKILGVENVDVIIKTDLTEEQKKKYRLYDNKAGEFADWDLTMLKKELEDLDFSDFDIDWGIDENEPEDAAEENIETKDVEKETKYECLECGYKW